MLVYISGKVGNIYTVRLIGTYSLKYIKAFKIKETNFFFNCIATTGSSLEIACKPFIALLGQIRKIFNEK